MEPSSNKNRDEIRIGRRVQQCKTYSNWQNEQRFPWILHKSCTTLARIIAKLKSLKLDTGTKYMPPSNLEYQKCMWIIYQKM